MRIAFLDCFSGVAGDMWVGALLDLGLPLADLERTVATLGLPGVEVRAQRVQRQTLAGTWFQVVTPGTIVVPGAVARRKPVPVAHGPHRGLADCLALVRRADLPGPVRERAEAVFVELARAEAAVHGTTPEQVHFHEVGAEDTIVDIVCTVLGSHRLGIERYYASSIELGSGSVRCAHGTMPVPAPGTLALVSGMPVRSTLAGERTTPTGAALLRVLVAGFEPRHAWVPERAGYGAGTRDPDDMPNLLRITLGDDRGPGAAAEVLEIRCNLDTATGEELGYLLAGCLARGAVDAFVTPATGKKGRPTQVLTVLVDAARREAIAGFLLEESTTLGLRYHVCGRQVLERWEETIATEFGPVRFKCARLPSGTVARRPEADEVARLVRERGLARREILARLG